MLDSAVRDVLYAPEAEVRRVPPAVTPKDLTAPSFPSNFPSDVPSDVEGAGLRVFAPVEIELAE